MVVAVGRAARMAGRPSPRPPITSVANPSPTQTQPPATAPAVPHP